MVLVRLFFGCLVYMLGAMSRVAVPGMVFERMVADYGLTSAQVALLPSAGVFGCMLFIGFGGVLVDRFGWARMLFFGSVLQAVAFVPVHESPGLVPMLVGEFFNGGGRTIVYLAVLKLFDVSFDRRYFAAMIGIFYVFGYGGTLGASAVFPWLVETCGSWQLAARAVNLGTFACVAAIALAAPVKREAPVSFAAAPVRSAFPWREMVASFSVPRAGLSMIVAGLNIAVYWSFLCVSAAPFARLYGAQSIVSEMNWVVMFGMVFTGSVALLLNNARRPFFLWGSGAVMAAFAVLLAASVLDVDGIAPYRTAYLLLGAGYGVTSVLLAGVKECVPSVYMASAIGFTNLFANVVQIGGNQASGALMAYGRNGYPFVFAVYLVLAAISFATAVRLLRVSRSGGETS